MLLSEIHHEGDWGCAWGRKTTVMLTCNVSLRFNVLGEVRLHKGKPLFNHALDIASTFTDIADD